MSLAAALLCAIVFLALAEVFVPNGSLPGPIALVRAVPSTWDRDRRCLQSSLIVAHHGLALRVLVAVFRDRSGAAEP